MGKSSALRSILIVYMLVAWRLCFASVPSYGICDIGEPITSFKGSIVSSNGVNCTRLILAPQGYRIDVTVHPGTFLRDSTKLFFYDGGTIRDDYAESEVTEFPYIHSYGNDQEFTSKSNAVVVHLDRCVRAILNITYKMFRQSPQRCACLPVVDGEARCKMDGFFGKGLGDTLERVCELHCKPGYHTYNSGFGRLLFQYSCEMDYKVNTGDVWTETVTHGGDRMHFQDKNEITCLIANRFSRSKFSMDFKYINISCQDIDLSFVAEKVSGHIINSTLLPHTGECFKDRESMNSPTCDVQSLNVSCSEIGNESVVKLVVQDNILTNNGTFTINNLGDALLNASQSLQQFIHKTLVFAGKNATFPVTRGPINFCPKSEVFNAYLPVLKGAGCSSCPKHFIPRNSAYLPCKQCHNGTRREINEMTCVNGERTYPAPSLAFCKHTCPIGKYFNPNSSLCEWCPFGTYQNSSTTVNPKCIACPDGKSTGFVGARNISECINLCPAGQYLKYLTCRMCGIGHFMPNNSNRFHKCKLCPTGKTTLGIGTKDEAGCVQRCTTGQYFNVTERLCLACPNDTYQDEVFNDNTRTCKICPPNTITGKTGSQSVSECLGNCSIGNYIDVSNGKCSLCPLNTYQDDGQHISLSCKSCGKHRITQQIGSTNFSNCIYPCGKGEFFNMTSEVCEKCQIGAYQNEVGKDFCQPCEGKSFTLKIGSHQCIQPCTYGEFLNKSAEKCQNCQQGYFQNITQHQMTTCQFCPLHQYNDQIGSRNCTLCPNSGVTVVTAAEHRNDCINPCEPGMFLNKTRKACQTCFKGYYQSQNKYKLEYCIKCPYAYQTTIGTGATSLEQCVGYCVSSPCFNGGECINIDYGFNCTCPENLEGKQCDKIIDEQNADVMEISIRFPELNWNTQLSNPESKEFIELAQNIESNARQEFENEQNFRTVKVVGFTQGSIITAMKFYYVAENALSTPADTIQLTNGKLGNLTIDSSSTKIINYTCGQPLGMESGRILNGSITSSSSIQDPQPAHYARLNYPEGGWAPLILSGDVYLQVDFGEQVLLTGIATQGSSYHGGSWLQTYFFRYSSDGSNWPYYSVDSVLHDIFPANVDVNTVVRNDLQQPVKARYIRIFEYHFHEWISYRIEFYGCPIPATVPLPTLSPSTATATTTTTSTSAVTTQRKNVEDDDDEGSNIGLIVGLVVGIPLLVLLVVVIVWCIKRHRGFHNLRNSSVANVMELETKSESDSNSK